MREWLQKYMDNIINSSKVVLFMKWSPEFPQCWFSARAVEILVDLDIEFSFFNILEDEEVRQGLKEYKNWPTYPQLYINSELIWWIDIMEEMLEWWEFSDILK